MSSKRKSPGEEGGGEKRRRPGFSFDKTMKVDSLSPSLSRLRRKRVNLLTGSSPNDDLLIFQVALN